jgi:hypothetical protein
VEDRYARCTEIDGAGLHSEEVSYISHILQIYGLVFVKGRDMYIIVQVVDGRLFGSIIDMDLGLKGMVAPRVIHNSCN